MPSHFTRDGLYDQRYPRADRTTRYPRGVDDFYEDPKMAYRNRQAEEQYDRDSRRKIRKQPSLDLKYPSSERDTARKEEEKEDATMHRKERMDRPTLPPRGRGAQRVQ
jgi:hypothetical protein